MEIDRKELKRQARERMALTDPKFWMVALTFLAMTTGVSWLISLIPLPGGTDIYTIQIFFQLLLMLYRAVVSFGMCLWALWTYRQLDPGVNSLMQGFSVAGRVLLMDLGIYVRIFGWYLLVAMVLSVPLFSLLLTNSSAGFRILTILAFLIALLVTIVVISLRYALAPYLLADRPDDGPSAPIYRSNALMRGWKMELFKLELSFLGWEAVNFLLSAAVMTFFLNQAGLLAVDAVMAAGWEDQCTAVIYSTPVVILSTLVTIPVSLWLLPYRAVARAGFYDARLLAASQEDSLPGMPLL